MDDSSIVAPGDDVSGVSVHAGFPNPAADSRTKNLDLNRLLIAHPSSTFLFRIRGEQGMGLGIFEGDIALVDRSASAGPSDLVLWHDGTAFKLSTPRHIREQAQLWGTVTALVRQLRTKS